jgi:quinol monooxygenase YgiN
MSSPQYETFMESLGSLTAGPPDIRHVKFESYSTKSMTAPITELFDMYLPASASNEKKQELADASSNLIKAILNDEGSEGAMDGHVVESVSHKSLGDEEGHALMAIIGWKSMENHTEFRNSESFKASIGPVRAAVKGAAMGHAILQKY